MTRPIKKIEEYGNRGVGNFKDDYAAASPTARAEWHRQQAERLRLSPRWRIGHHMMAWSHDHLAKLAEEE